MQLDAKALGLAAGILGGAFWLVAMFISLLTGLADQTLSNWGSFYPFFSYSWTGMIIAAVEEFICGVVSGWLFATIYNKLLKQLSGQ